MEVKRFDKIKDHVEIDMERKDGSEVLLTFTALEIAFMYYELRDLQSQVSNTDSLHDVTNCYQLTEEQKKKMDKHKANSIKFSHGSGIGVSVEIKTKKGKWKDITDYSCW
jgi:hypothetical protein